MSITECMTVTSPSPTNGPNARRPDALGETISFGTPTGSACMAAAPSSAPSAPPRHSTPCTRPSAYSRSTTARTPSSISCTAAPREPASRIVVEPVPGGARDLLARDVGRAAVGLAEDPGVDHDRARAERAQPVADVGDLGPLGVEGADQRDAGLGGHARRSDLAPSTADSAWRRRSIESWTYWS